MNDFIKTMLSSSNQASCKRFAGLIGWFVFIIIIVSMILLNKTLDPISSEALHTLGYLSASLIGLETITNVFKKLK